MARESPGDHMVAVGGCGGYDGGMCWMETFLEANRVVACGIVGFMSCKEKCKPVIVGLPCILSFIGIKIEVWVLVSSLRSLHLNPLSYCSRP